jgi:hypothetical protein
MSKHIARTTDAFPGLTPKERRKLFVKELLKNRKKTKTKKNDNNKHTNGTAEI